MSDFWKSYDITALEYGEGYQCYPLYGKIHRIELALSLLFIVGVALWYKRSGAKLRRKILVGVTGLLLLDEAALLLGMALTGQWNWSYLPLHLCSINVFVCLYNTLFDQNWCKEELYALCIPGAALALLCPSWLDVPSWWTLINLHSISIHALLVLYPVLLVVGGYRPSVRRVPQVLAFLFGSALPIYFLNKPLCTNFYFLNNPYGNVITTAFTNLLGEKYYNSRLPARHCGGAGADVSAVGGGRPPEVTYPDFEHAYSKSLPALRRGVFVSKNAPFLQIKNAVFLRIAVKFRIFDFWAKNFAKALDRGCSA